MKKVLVIGCGSIGQRHIRALKRLDDIAIAAYRTRKGHCQGFPREFKDIREFSNEKDAFIWSPDYMVISNPTSLHLEYLLKGIDARIENIFVEKPVANDFKDIKRHIRKLLDYKGNIAVGFNLRFHIVTKKIKELVESKRYGNVLKARLEAGHYLPDWHPYEDYRNTYAARRELGGGVLRTLCHEIDLAQYLFGDFKDVYGEVDKIGNLDIDVDDSVHMLASMDNGIKVEIKLDYLRPMPDRKGEILFENGLLEYDFNEPRLRYADYRKKDWEILFSTDMYDKQNQYQDQMKAFIDKDYTLFCNLKEGIEVMRVIELVEKSSKKRKSYVPVK